MQNFYSGSLGGERESIESVQLGTQELTLTSTGPIPNFVSEAKILDIPFLFRDKAHAYAVLDGPIGDEMLKLFDSKGFKALAWAENELKIYPNLMAHVVESVEGILERPHGCGEQTISSTYPSLLILRRDKQLATDSHLGKKAQRYAELGYQRLLNYRTEDGGFSYWGRGDADLALTAYALRFLHDAREFVSVDDEVIKGARQWLIRKQQADGSWPAYDYYPQQETGKPLLVLDDEDSHTTPL